MSLRKNIGTLIGDVADMGWSFGFAAVRARLRRKMIVVRLPGGASMRVRGGDSDFSTVRQVFRRGEYKVPVRAVADRISRFYEAIKSAGGVPVIVDAGANIGAATAWFRWQFPDAVIVAVEPDPENAALLRENMRSYSRAIVQEAAIGSGRGFVDLIESDKSWGIQTQRAESGCPMMTIDDAVALVENGKLFIAKIDIEGFESDLFDDNVGWLDNCKVVYIEPHDWMLPGRATSRAFQSAVANRDFEIFINGENLIYVKLGELN